MTTKEAMAQFETAKGELARLRDERQKIQADLAGAIKAASGELIVACRKRGEDLDDLIFSAEVEFMRAEIALSEAKIEEARPQLEAAQKDYEKAVEKRVKAAEEEARLANIVADFRAEQQDLRRRAGELRRAIDDRIAAELRKSEKRAQAA